MVKQLLDGFETCLGLVLLNVDYVERPLVDRRVCRKISKVADVVDRTSNASRESFLGIRLGEYRIYLVR